MDQGEVLLDFASALVGEDDTALGRARAGVHAALGAEGVVDAAAVASNFERMVRIADATGIPIDGPVDLLGSDLRAELELDRFASDASRAASAGRLKQALSRALRPAAVRVLQRIATRRMGREALSLRGSRPSR